jgi:hypothetical protein
MIGGAFHNALRTGYIVYPKNLYNVVMPVIIQMDDLNYSSGAQQLHV